MTTTQQEEAKASLSGTGGQTSAEELPDYQERDYDPSPSNQPSHQAIEEQYREEDEEEEEGEFEMMIPDHEEAPMVVVVDEGASNNNEVNFELENGHVFIDENGNVRVFIFLNIIVTFVLYLSFLVVYLI